MRFLLLLAIFSLSFKVSKAQQPCGTALTEEMKARLIDYNLHKSDFDQSNTDRVVRFVPIQFHIVGRSNGSGHYVLSNIWPLLCDLNTRYGPTGFYFYLYNDVQYIDNDVYFKHDFNSGDQMMNENNVAGVTNVYIVDDPAGYCGYYTYGEDAITIAKSCNAPGSTTLSHELGHYFSLPHPFDIVGTQKEFVNGNNCSFAGDLFCDTRADFIDYRWSCPYTGSDTDPNGDVYDPDETLYMSYSYDNCQNKFTNEQMSAMNYNLTFDRTDLSNHPVPDVSPIVGIEQLIYPIDSIGDIPHDFVELKWAPMDGAAYYHVQVTRAPVFGGEPTDLDLLVHSTAVTIGLDPDKKYHWRVLPLKNGYTCAAWSPSETFFTVMGTGVSEITSTNPDFNIYPNFLNSGSTFNISLNTKKSGNAEIRIISENGIVINHLNVSLVKGENNLKMATVGLPIGLYLVSISADGSFSQQRIVIIK